MKHEEGCEAQGLRDYASADANSSGAPGRGSLTPADAGSCDCCKGSEHKHTPWHPPTWRLLKSSAPLPGLSHTKAHFQREDGIRVLWNSRSHRKGRAPLLRTPQGKLVTLHRPPLVILNLDVGNISWWLGCVFTVASAVWVVNGVYLFSPPPGAANMEKLLGSTALVGGGMFIIGGYLGVLESLNSKPEVQVSYVVAKDDAGDDVEANPGQWVAKALSEPPSTGPKQRKSSKAVPEKKTKQRFRFWGWEPRSLGFLANFLVLVGALIFYIPCVTGYYTVFGRLSPAAVDVLYWLPQVVASVLFVVSPTLGMLEVQGSWFKLRPFNLGWQSAFWNWVGGWGFLLSGAFGFAIENQSVATWGVFFSTLWGSVAFLIGSMIQWFECMNPHELRF